MVQAPLPRGRPGEEGLRGGEGRQGEVDGVDVHPLRRSKPSALCPPGCYPRCPKLRPIYDEELKACVTRDQCGCYIDNTHYSPGTSVPAGHICHAWYLSSRHRGPGEVGAHTQTCTPTNTHAHGGREGWPVLPLHLASSLLCPHWEPRWGPEPAFGAASP